MAGIAQVGAREILDSRGNPTVEVEVSLDDGTFSRAAVPSGASTGAFEAVELRDGEDRYGGKGVHKAVAAVLEMIGPALVSKDFEASDQRLIDARCSIWTRRPTRAAWAPTRSWACRSPWRRRAAESAELPLFRYLGGPNAYLLPVPMFNILNGGAHADSNVDIQEFMIAPIGAPTFAEALRWGAEVYHALKAVLSAKGLSTGLGDEGGFAPTSNRTARRSTSSSRRSARPAFARATTSRSRLTPRPTSSTRTARTSSRARAKTAERDDRLLLDADRVLPDRVAGGPAGRGRLGRLEGAYRRSSTTRCRSSATTCS